MIEVVLLCCNAPAQTMLELCPLISTTDYQQMQEKKAPQVPSGKKLFPMPFECKWQIFDFGFAKMSSQGEEGGDGHRIEEENA
jgi:hypothetical protein